MKINKDDLVLVTGGAGFIGSALVWALNQRGLDRVWISDYLGTDERFKNLVPLAFEDYLAADDLLQLIANKDPRLAEVRYVFHLGACSSTTEQDSAYLMRNNYEYTKTLATWACNEPGVRFVYASSAATYGDGTQGMDDQVTPLQSLKPLNKYGYSKHLFDTWAQKKGLFPQIVGLKYFNVFGPNEYHKVGMRSMVHKAFEQIQAQGHIELFKSYHPDYADGEQKRDFLYVKDAVNMTLHLAECPTAGGLYNLGSGQAHSWLELANAIFQAMELPPSIRFVDMPESLRAHYQYYTQASLDKLRATGYTQPITPLASAVFDYVQHYLIPNRHLGEAVVPSCRI